MDIIPDMPDDWFPEGAFIVSSKDSGNELGFAITKESYLDGRWKAEIEPCLQALRRSLWHAKHMSDEEKERYELKELVGGSSIQV